MLGHSSVYPFTCLFINPLIFLRGPLCPSCDFARIHSHLPTEKSLVTLPRSFAGTRRAAKTVSRPVPCGPLRLNMTAPAPLFQPRAGNEDPFHVCVSYFRRWGRCCKHPPSSVLKRYLVFLSTRSPLCPCLPGKNRREASPVQSPSQTALLAPKPRRASQRFTLSKVSPTQRGRGNTRTLTRPPQQSGGRGVR